MKNNFFIVEVEYIHYPDSHDTDTRSTFIFVVLFDDVFSQNRLTFDFIEKRYFRKLFLKSYNLYVLKSAFDSISHAH